MSSYVRHVGEGGMGKSTLTRLLVQKWRSQRLRVVITAASAKAARLIDGYTVHSAFDLREEGGCISSGLMRGQQGTDR